MYNKRKGGGDIHPPFQQESEETQMVARKNQKTEWEVMKVQSFPDPKFELKEKVLLKGKESTITGRWFALKPSDKVYSYDETNQKTGWYYECDSDVFTNVAEESIHKLQETPNV